MQRRVFLSIATLLTAMSVQSQEPIRIGMIGLDTSHVIAFTRLINDTDHPGHVPGGRVVAAYKGGSPDVEASRTRVDGFTDRLREDFGVKIVDTIEALGKEVDAVMLMSVDGRPHLEQARPVIRSGKPLFIDKPVAGSLADAIEIYRLAEKHGVPVFSSSSYRFYPTLTGLKERDFGRIRSVISYGPASTEPHHPTLFWYGVHPTEALFTMMGTGCESVVSTHSSHTDVVTGKWADGRIGTLVGLREGASPHRVIVFGTEKVAEQESGGSTYAPLVQEIIRFFETGIPPVKPRETIEIFAFMEAADESQRRGGNSVSISDLIEKANSVHSPEPGQKKEL